MLHFYFIFWATPPYVPFVPLEGTDADLFFDDDVSNEALIELRRFVIDFVETHEPGTPDLAGGTEQRALRQRSNVMAELTAGSESDG